MSEKAFNFIKERRKYFNISKIEEYCEITRTSLLNAINRDQKNFGHSDKLHSFLNKYFKGWDNK